MKQPLLAFGLLLSATTFNANASLTSYTVNGVDMVRMQGAGFDVSLTKDGNLFKTLADSNANLISQIAAVTPIYNDPAYGIQTIDASHYVISTGQMTWWGGKAFVNYLNNISYGGSNLWTLPDWIDTGATGVQCNNNGGDCGYNVNPSSSPLAQLYYGELNKIANLDPSGKVQDRWGIFSNNGLQIANGVVGPFINVKSAYYWLGTEFSGKPEELPPAAAWVFATIHGYQNDDYAKHNNLMYAWPVSSGQVAAVPVPGAL